MQAIEFWFDFSSPYAYFAAQGIDALAERHGRSVLWRPYMLGTAFKVTGARGLSGTPLKGDYARRDWARISRQTGTPFAIPEGHPIAALPASRTYYWIEGRFPDQAHAFALRAFRAYFVDGIDMADIANVAREAEPLGVPTDELLEGMTSPAIKDQLVAIGAQALERSVFGSPFFRVDGEPFWGWDRMPMLEEWLRSGGW